MMNSLIRFESANLGYPDKTVLESVSCAVEPGASVGLVGPNGSGKTTFLKGVLGLLKPFSGSIEVDRSQRFAYVPQAEELNYFWPITVRQAVMLPDKSRRPWGRLTEEEKKAGQEAMEKAGVASLQDRLLRELSGGQKQRVILAQALSQKPGVLLLDEPTRGLDVVAEMELLMLIEDLHKKERLTILFVTHNLQIPLNWCEKILLFNHGRVVPSSSADLVHSKKLEEVYGAPFVLHEADGQRWVTPVVKKS